MINKYLKRAHISERQFRRVLKLFSQDFEATKIGQLTGISRISINKIFKKLRLRILDLSNAELKVNGEVEVDETYFGPTRVRGKRGRGASGKIPVIGILKRKGKVYTQIINNCTRKELLPVIKGKVLEDSIIYTDSWKSYDGLVLNGYKHYRIHHKRNEFARGKNHINGIESFWSYMKRRLRKFNGIRKDQFILHLKESEYRWNYKDKLYSKLLKILRNYPL